MRLVIMIVLSLVALLLCGCKPRTPNTSVRPTGTGQQTAPGNTFHHLGEGNSSTSVPAAPANRPAS